MADPWDRFFIEKIKEGLSASSQSLTPEEETMLKKPVKGLGESTDFSPEQAQPRESYKIGTSASAGRRKRRPPDASLSLHCSCS